MISSSIPVFDMAELSLDNLAAESRLRAARSGVFYLRHNKQLQLQHDLAAAEALHFFTQASESERRAATNHDPTIRRGFSPLESESTAKATRLGTSTDYALAFSMGVGKNLFPSNDFAMAWDRYFGGLSAVAHDVAAALFRQTFDRKTVKSESLVSCDPVLRFRYFPEVPHNRCAEFDACRMAEHYDLSILTLIQQTPCENGFISLQARIDGALVDVPPVEGMLVVMCGAVAPLLSGGSIEVPRHRVQAPPLSLRQGSSRTSSVFFLRPAANFRFSVDLARKCGLDVTTPGTSITFSQWMAENYTEMRTNGR